MGGDLGQGQGGGHWGPENLSFVKLCLDVRGCRRAGQHSQKGLRFLSFSLMSKVTSSLGSDLSLHQHGK